MIGDLLIAARRCWFLLLSVPAALSSLWGASWILTVAGVAGLLISAVFASVSAFYRGETAAMRRELR